MSDNPKSTAFSASKLLRSFSFKAINRPTSIVETKPFSVSNLPFFSEKSYKKPHWTYKDSSCVGLRIIEALDNRPLHSSSSMIFVGSQLKIQIPKAESSSNSSVESPYSAIEFGIKNKDSLMTLISPPDLSIEGPPPSPEIFTREMELLEEYTCVISHGPNPKKTHIFDNGVAMVRSSDCLSADFLSFCHACNKALVSEDIFMYRCEVAFCSRECRQLELISDDELKSALN